MNRREFIAVVGGATAWPVGASAQQLVPVVGFLNNASPHGYAPMVAAFGRGLNEAGYVEGQNVTIEYHWAENQYALLPALADELVRRQVTVIVANGPAVSAAKAATTTIPIVFTMAGDPVELGFVANLNRPGDNVTGVTNLNLEVAPKRVELLHELVPTANIFALLLNPTNPNSDILARELEGPARTFGLQIHVIHATSARDFDAVFARLAETRAQGLVISPDTLFVSRSDQLAALTVRHGVPAIHSFAPFARAGGLMSYAINLADVYRIAGGYVGRILNGEKAGDLPVQQVTTVQLTINVKTAKALGLTVPPTLFARADEVIE